MKELFIFLSSPFFASNFVWSRKCATRTGWQALRQFLLIGYKLEDICMALPIGRKRRAKDHVSLFSRETLLSGLQRAACVCPGSSCTDLCLSDLFLSLLLQFDGFSTWMLPQQPRKMPERLWRTSWLKNARSCSRLSWKSKSVRNRLHCLIPAAVHGSIVWF